MSHRRDHGSRKANPPAAPEPDTNPETPALAGVVRFKITATGRQRDDLLELLRGLLLAGRPDYRTGATITIVANADFFDVRKELRKHGTFRRNIPSPPRRTQAA